MGVEELLFRVGIPTYKTNIQVDLPGAAQPQSFLNQKAPTNIGWIYGISVNVGGTAPLDATKNLITLADAGNLWLTIKIGSNDFMETLRLSDLVYQEANVSRSQERNYAPVSIPNTMDWQKSYVSNVNGVVNKTVLFNLWYIDKDSYAQLTNSGVLGKSGNKPT